jgi:L-fuconolactonase
MIIDAHHHLWDLERTPQPWMTAEHDAIARTFGPADMEPLLTACGVTQTVLVQGACTDDDTDYLFEVADVHAWIGAITAWVALDDPDACRRRLGELGTRPKLRGIRHLIHEEPDPHWIVRPSVLEGIALVEDAGLVLELPVVYPRHFGDVAELALRFPRLRIVIDHLGKPPFGTPDMSAWEAALRACAEYPNVLAKISGLNTAIPQRDWSATDLRHPLEVAVDCFGADRLMWGSDWPVALLNGSYERVLEASVTVLEEIVPDAAAAILNGTAVRVYRLDGIEGPSAPSTGEAHGRAH